MRLHPFYTCVKQATSYIADGANVYQQWNCAHCGAKQTMEIANVFYKLGNCEECGKTTNIEQNGCNYMLSMGVRRISPI